jgi:predicted small lipoprotein YifL
MKRLFVFLTAVLVAVAFSACGTPPRQPPPEYEKVHQDHQEAQEDLADEEDKQKEEDE